VGEIDLESLVRFFRANPWIAAVAVYFVAVLLRAMSRNAKKEADKAKGARMPERRVADADLQERVRSGFEQMMRERAAGRSAAARAAAGAGPANTPPRREPRVAAPAPRSVPAPRPPSPPALRPVPQARTNAVAAPRLASTVPLIAHVRMIQRTDNDAPSSNARRLMSDRSSLRRAVLASEILGTPLALRDPR
jgi:hypothetical protein